MCAPHDKHPANACPLFCHVTRRIVSRGVVEWVTWRLLGSYLRVDCGEQILIWKPSHFLCIVWILSVVFFAPCYSSVNCLAAIFWLRCCVSLFQTLPRFVDLVWKERCWSTDKFRRWLANVSSVWNNWVFCVVPYQNWSCDFLISTFVALARRYLLEWTTWCSWHIWNQVESISRWHFNNNPSCCALRTVVAYPAARRDKLKKWPRSERRNVYSIRNLK